MSTMTVETIISIYYPVAGLFLIIADLIMDSGNYE